MTTRRTQMKFCTFVQNFGDELGRLSYEAMTIPVTDRDNSIVENDGVIDFSWIGDRDLQKIQAENRKAIQIREILQDGQDWTR